ncbi:MAG: DUF58 domain-containing protein [Thermosipho sp. (in: Bacteria)]|nr:DUF58 domain-containing protein [Thermosipho sp. (in: thermotogales)]
MEVQNNKLLFLTIAVIFLNFFYINGITLFLLAFTILQWIYYLLMIKIFDKLTVKVYFKNQRALINEEVKLLVDINSEISNLNITLSIPDIALSHEVITLNKGVNQYSFSHSYYSRGKKYIDKLFLSYKSPFYKIIKKFEIDASIFILPNYEYVKFNKEKLLELIPNLKSHLRLLEDPTYIVGIREYNNDPVKRIHWKISAKYGNLVVKNYEFTSQGKLFIALFLNLHPEVFSRKAWKPILKKYVEDVITGVAGIIKDSTEKNIPTKLLVDTDEGIKEVFSSDWIDHYDVLAQSYGSIEKYNYKIFEKVNNEISFNDTLLIVTMYLTENDMPYILNLREKCSKIIVLILPYGFRSFQTKKFKSYLAVPPDIIELQKKALILRENDVFVAVFNENTALQEGFRLVD